METGTHALTQLLAMAALVAGTAQYATLIRRRAAGRALAAHQLAGLKDDSLRGLVRVFAAGRTQEQSR